MNDAASMSYINAADVDSAVHISTDCREISDDWSRLIASCAVVRQSVFFPYSTGPSTAQLMSQLSCLNHGCSNACPLSILPA